MKSNIERILKAYTLLDMLASQVETLQARVHQIEEERKAERRLALTEPSELKSSLKEVFTPGRCFKSTAGLHWVVRDEGENGRCIPVLMPGLPEDTLLRDLTPHHEGDIIPK